MWITLIALVATGAALTLRYLGTTRLIEARSHALVDDEATSLVDRDSTGGLPALAGAIEREQQLPRINEFFYLLANPDGSPIAGNLVAWPSEVDEVGYHCFTTQVNSLRTAPRQRRVEVRAMLLEGGFRRLLGFWYSRRGLAFLDAAAHTGDRFLAGRLDERLPVSGQGDEYDRLTATINRSFEEVERLVGSLRAATDGLAHDLKTPLTRIKARLELAEMESAFAEALRDIAADSRHDLDTLLRLIDDILALARGEETAAASFVPLALEQIVAETVELFEPVAEDKGVELTATIDPATVTGARSLLPQATANLIDNAVKYTPAGGRVHVAVGQEDSQVRLAMSDTGPGIPAELRDHALTRFARLDASRSEPGSGIGLSIVTIAARLHRAELRLSDADPGLRVEMVFPGNRNGLHTSSLG